MTAVMIGIDPRKSSHTAVAIGTAEEPLDELRVTACRSQAGQLVAWAAGWPGRTWAVEGAGGLGHLLARQLVAAGERVLDVPPKLAARVRLLQSGDTNENDPDDARSVAVAALRSRARQDVAAEDHAAVLKIWSRRHRDLARARNQVACRLHAVLCDLVPGGVAGEITAGRAARILDQAARTGRPPPPAVTWPPSSSRTCAAWTSSAASAARGSPRRSGPRALGDGPVRRRPGHRRPRPRRRPAGDPVPQPGPFRRLQRHRPGRGVLRRADGAPAVAAR